MELNEPALLLADGFLVAQRSASRASTRAAASRGSISCARVKRIPFPDRERDKVMASLLSLPVVPPLEIDEPLRFEQREGSRASGCKITQHKNAWGEEFFEGRLLTRLRPRLGRRHGAAARGIWLPEERVYVLRDQAAEAARAADARRARAQAARRPAGRVPAAHASDAARRPRTAARRAGTSRPKARRSAAPAPPAWTSARGIDWFELRGEVDYGGGRPPRLPQLLAALRRGETMVRLGDGTFGLLPEEWLARFAPLAGLGANEEDHLRFRRNQAGLLDALLAAQPEVHVDEVFARVREKLRDFHGVTPRGAARRASSGNCAITSAKASAGCSSCASSVSAAAWPTTWASAKRRRCWPCSKRGARRARAVAGGRAEIADVQLARRGGEVHAAAPRPGAHRPGARHRADRASTTSS